LFGLIINILKAKSMALDWISAAVEDQYEEVVHFRRVLHTNPELSFQEYQTARFIEDKLSEISLERLCETGLVGIIEPINTLNHSTCIALRADIDALPIQEETDLAFRSNNSGIMHACGHDMHTAILMGVSKIIQKNRDKLKRRVKLIFQPGEEKLPGGASMMIESGVLQNPQVDNIFGLHVLPDLETGKIGFRSGPYMASCDEIHLTVHGQGGHAALPHKTIDPIAIAAQIILQAQTIISRHGDPTIPSVLSFGYIVGLGATNIIPDKVELKGTFRTMNEQWRRKAHQLLEDLVHNTCITHGAQADLKIEIGYPFLVNNDRVTDYAINATSKLFQKDQIVDLDVRMTAEDFSYYSQFVPATFFRIGVQNLSKSQSFGLHNSRFNPDEDALKSGMKAFLAIVFDD
jgi:amidohydrolase